MKLLQFLAEKNAMENITSPVEKMDRSVKSFCQTFLTTLFCVLDLRYVEILYREHAEIRLLGYTCTKVFEEAESGHLFEVYVCNLNQITTLNTALIKIAPTKIIFIATKDSKKSNLSKLISRISRTKKGRTDRDSSYAM